MKPWGEQSREGNYVQKALIEGKVGGMAHVATVIKRLKAEKPGKNLVLDAGDTWHGAGISLFDRGVGMNIVCSYDTYGFSRKNCSRGDK